MLFNSLVFPIFLVIVLTWHWLLKSHAARNRLLLIASLVFYGWWDYRFLSLLFVSSFVDYLCGLGLEKSNSPRHRKVMLVASLSVNLGLLGAFKYFNFFSESAAYTLGLLGFQADWITLNVILPVGISFYTFQTISYTVDVYLRRIPACRSLADFMTFVAFFPQLVAGPIERAQDLLPQIVAPRRFDREMADRGLRWILWGFILKCVVADNMAAIVTQVYQDPAQYSAGSLVIATYCFAFQIYGDFAGYSAIATGVAALFGVRLMENFRAPYLSQSMREFWKRWHVSLSTWFGDYVYIGLLGGNRVGPVRQHVNIMSTFVLSGLWHGANWTFVLWGVLNGFLYFLPPPFSARSKLGVVLNGIVCFHLACLTWVFFRATSVSEAFVILSRIAQWQSGEELVWVSDCVWRLAIMLIVVTGELLQRWQPGFASLPYLPRYVRYTVYYVGILLLFFGGSFERRPFIYFQF